MLMVDCHGGFTGRYILRSRPPQHPKNTSTGVALLLLIFAWLSLPVPGRAAVTVSPSEVTVQEGEAVTFSAMATGTQPMLYQWYQKGIGPSFGWSPIRGATNLTLSLVAGLLQPGYPAEGLFALVVIEPDWTETWSAPARLNVLRPPWVSVTPAFQYVPLGQSVTLTGSTVSLLPVTCQWLKDREPIPGATNRDYTVASMTLADAGRYVLQARNDLGVGESLAASLTTDRPLVFNDEPRTQIVSLGQSVRLTAVVSGTKPARAQWFLNGQAIPGGPAEPSEYSPDATQSVLLVSNVGTDDLGDYHVEFSNVAGTIRSRTGTLKLGNRPTIVGQPNLRPYVGDSATLVVQIEGAGPFGYSWYFNGTQISGASSLFLKAEPAAIGEYQVQVSTPQGLVWSDPVQFDLDMSYDPVLRLAVRFRTCTEAVFPLERYVTRPGGQERYRLYREGMPIVEFGLGSGFPTVGGITPSVTSLYWVAQIDSNGQELTRSPPVRATPPDCNERVPPTVPTITWFKAYCDRVSIRWTDSTDPDGGAVSRYNLYRDDQWVDWRAIGNRAFEYTGLTPGTTYRFSMAAVDLVGNESPRSVPIQLETPPCDVSRPPERPTQFYARATACRELEVTWAKPAGGAEILYYKIYVNGEAHLVPGTSNELTLSKVAPGSRFTISAVAVGHSGTESAATTPAIVDTPTCDGSTPPSVPQAISARGVGCEAIRIEWSSANDGGSGLMGYNLYRDGALLQFVPPVSDRECVTLDTAPRFSFRHTYEVTALDFSGHESARSVATHFTLTPCPPSVVQGLRVTPLNCEEVEILWEPPAPQAGTVLRGYRLLRNNQFLKEVPLTETRATDREAQGNTRYTYAVIAIDQDGAPSPPEGAFVTTPVCPDASPPPTPVLAVRASGCLELVLSWTAVADVGPSGLSRYVVSRNGAVIAEVAAHQTTYPDRQVQPSTVYTYSVMAHDVAGNQSAPSAWVSASTERCWEPVGQVVFSNRIGVEVLAPITLPDGSGPGAEGQAQLCLVSPDGRVIGLQPTATFRTSSVEASRFLNQLVINVPGTRPGTKVDLQVRAWIGPSFETAALRGQSAVVTVILGGDVMVPPNLVGLRGFALEPVGGNDIDLEPETRPSQLIVQQPGGRLAFWSLSGTNLQETTIWTTVPDDWWIVAAGDFNADGHMDFLLENAQRQLAFWLMRATVLTEGVLWGELPDGWDVVAAGDFDGDGHSDILLLHSDGTLAFWFMEGPRLREGVLGDQLPASWAVVGASDFNGDGMSDVVLLGPERAIAYWFMDGARIQQGISPYPLEAGWDIVGAGDFDGDGQSDLAFEGTDRSLAFWSMSGTAIRNAFRLNAFAHGARIANRP